MLLDISKANIEVLHDELFVQKQVTLSVLRLDKIHPLVSGNKLFKLHYFLEEALACKHDTVLARIFDGQNHIDVDHVKTAEGNADRSNKSAECF